MLLDRWLLGIIAAPLLLSVLASQGCAVLPAADGDRPGGEDNDPAARLAGLLTGEYTNHAQVWAARQSGGTAPTEYHLTLTRLDEGSDAPPLLHLRQFRAGETSSPVRDARLILSPGEGGKVVQAVQRRRNGEWQTLAGCEVLWRATAAGFQGSTRGDGCRFRDSRDGGVVTLHREWAVASDGLRLTQRRDASGATATETLAFVPVRWYGGWAGVRERDARGRDGGEWRLDRRLRLHDGGAVRRLPETPDATHAIRLERLEWPNSGIRMLRLSVIEAESGDVVAYAWAPPGAGSIGINLGWVQVGLETSEPR